MSETKVNPEKDVQPKRADTSRSDRCDVYVAIPDMVGTGDSKRPFAEPGEKVSVSERNAYELETRELAYRKKDLADAKFEMWQRRQKENARLEREAAARRAGLRPVPEGMERDRP